MLSEMRSRLLRSVRFFSVSTVAILLSACATVVPSYDIPEGPGGPTVQSIIAEITCELSRQIEPSAPNREFLLQQDIDVAGQLNLTVNDTGGIAPSLSYLGGPTFSFMGNALLSSSREQNFTEKLFFSMRDLAHDLERNHDTPADLRRCPHLDTNLSGNLGIKEMIDLAVYSPYLRRSVALTGSDGAFGGYIKFVITKNVNAVGPMWTLTRFKGPGGLLSGSEANTDQLTLAFAQGPNHKTAFVANVPEPIVGVAPAQHLLDSIILNQISTSLSTPR